ncbi:N-acetylglucosamine-specific PTS transporter subunit IIBC [Staphylococcus sp. NRL 16/872]|uniref:N-acetylglucosamine-specific PTS transporter subunit IIBC n=1 Tax=Staphylococcus sp. NRL 16/872 TaxID=2930131 RepID=UPI001FB50D8F|nr:MULTISPECIES: N-acetylglucosamine-specific PTS transporter subunit IIBC [unclassified Staphylococcus]MCJ1656129.1 N-acetylglucosamine-specific PTS transporter subunit IIBC [Staphylococcus sp. NRL 21/187]MCJ1661913.1 N-acetylglucosamine-specific PTS transporter subunit IIBC [Staphylococcus sp. NRL 18/288]MCJ1667947.1 N-acetylglucosamine-specific PTS transporter subunit IIBC [Staphylococcus sp. NRL 19/737]WEN70432.1 N-acetylglucosamine-specific PTS transporter subunit IIBC [Staphylococcus sp. 
MFKFFQNLGRSLMLPVAVLPAGAIITGIGNLLKALHVLPTIALFFSTVGTAILLQLGLIFAIGVAIGMAKKNDGAVALAAALGYALVVEVLSPKHIAPLFNIKISAVNQGFEKMDNSNVFIGIIIGLIAAYCYNKFSDVELPLALSFFSGKRLVPIMTVFFCTFLIVILMFTWPYIYSAIVQFGEWLVGFGPFGAFLYGFFNRLLIPTGLHHALNAVFWFDTAGINDIGKFQTGQGAIKGITGRYQAGFFPIMMFGMPAAALAMYHTAQSSQKKQVYGWFLASAISAFIVGVTEPIEFAFMFVAPVLFVIHAFLTGLSLFIASFFHWTAGFSFSAGLIDYALSLINPVANHPLMIFVQGIVFFILYYVIFRVIIQVFNLNTIGRGTNLLADPTDDTTDDSTDQAIASGKGRYHKTASQILEGLGGSENINTLTNCATRLRMELKDNSIIDEQKIRNAGAVGVTKNGKHSTQVIIGTHVQQVADEIEKQMH